MSYYYSAADDAAALRANDTPAGPHPGHPDYDSIDERGVLASPHLWELTALAEAIPYTDHTRELVSIWPPRTAEPPTGPIAQTVQRLPDGLRDDLAAISADAGLAARWAPSVYGMTADEALGFVTALSGLANRARAAGQHLYWWATL